MRSGYKQTEVGVIPEHWDALAIGRIVTGVASGTSNTKTVTGDVPIYGSTGVIGTTLVADYSGDKILIARVGANAGTVNRVAGRYSVSDNTLMVSLNEGQNLDFVYFQLLRKNLNTLVYGSGQPLVTGSQIKALRIPVPQDSNEQKAIAEALSDVDGLIAGLEALIAKKRDLKTATMQQLLTGKTRLPGFGEGVGMKQTELGKIPEDWGVFKFGRNFNIFAGGDVPKHSLSGIQTEEHPHPIFANAIRKSGLYGYTAEKRSEGNSITITARGFLGHAEYRSVPFFPIVRLLVMEPTGGLDAKFATYSINERVEFAIESTGVPQLTAPQVKRYSLAAPRNKEEQESIATVLSDMDELIADLDARLNKSKALKQGMMQELLTGRTRLI